MGELSTMKDLKYASTKFYKALSFLRTWGIQVLFIEIKAHHSDGLLFKLFLNGV